MSNLYPFARTLWSLTAAGAGTTLSAAGNSGNWAGTGAGDIYPQVTAETAIDLRDTADVVLMVTVAGVTGTPALVVSLDVFDDLGNAFPAVLSTASLAAAGSKLVAGGLHGPAAGTYLVLPRWARVSWAGLTSASVTGCEIALTGR